MFSSRTPSDLSPNRLTEAIHRVRAAGRSVIDLTASNPTRAGFDYHPDLLEPLAHPRGLMYRPQANGLLDARQAVADDFARRGIEISAERLVLTASTSEAYSLLFKVFGDPGDEVLVPRPSYPLFEHLARLDGLRTSFYDIEYHGRWELDVAGLERAVSDRTRVVLVVSPNNPTGTYLKRDELLAIERICADRGLALVVDEVFADYRLTDGGPPIGQPLECREALAFSLGGFSKSIGLPQLKLGWIAAAGPDGLVTDALGRLEFAADTYLSVGTPVQAAASDLFRRGAPIREAIQARIAENFRTLRHAVSPESGCGVLHVEGGWYAVLQVPSLVPEDDLVLALLETHGILVHPGYFFDFPRESFLVVSLLTQSTEFEAGVTQLVRHCACSGGGR